MRHASGAGRQSHPWGGCGRGFPLLQGGGVWGASPRKNWKSACSEVHSGAFSGPKSYFLGRWVFLKSVSLPVSRVSWKLCLLIYITMLFPCTYYIRIKIDLFPSSVPVITWINFWNLFLQSEFSYLLKIKMNSFMTNALKKPSIVISASRNDLANTKFEWKAEI